LVLTQGDPAGIGPEIALRAWLAARVPPFAVLTDLRSLRARAARLGLGCEMAAVEPEEVAGAFATVLPVIDTGTGFEPEPGRPTAESAPGTLASIERAVRLVREERAAAVVTNPIAKHVLYEAGFRYPGHTEYLGVLAGEMWGGAHRPVMMLWCPALAVTPVTVHIPLRHVPEMLTVDLIVETGRIVARDLAFRFGIARPRLVLCGLNPHAGEGGALGSEDEAVVRPAADRLRQEGIDAVGPLPADTLFHARARARYDAVLAMYHDQALLPIKTIAFDEAVNVTLGLPFVRTSPDHGTAFDIAASGIASCSSLEAALTLAARLAGADAWT